VPSRFRGDKISALKITNKNFAPLRLSGKKQYKLVPYYAKAILKFKIITEIISTANPADEVNSIAYASF